MKKLLISILIILLITCCCIAVIKGFQIGNLKVLSIADIQTKNKDIDTVIQNATKLASTDYQKVVSDIQTDVKKLEEEKKNYEDIVTLNSGDKTKVTSQKKYEVEYLWTTIGNHATSEGVTLKLVFVKTAIKDDYNLAFTVTGEYVQIAQFIEDIEEDSRLGFKIEEFNLVPNSSTSELQATFVCKNVSIADISESTMINIPNNQTDKENTNQTDKNTTNNANTTNSSNNTSNTNATNSLNTTNSANTTNSTATTNSNVTNTSSAK